MRLCNLSTRSDKLRAFFLVIAEDYHMLAKRELFRRHHAASLFKGMGLYVA